MKRLYPFLVILLLNACASHHYDAHVAAIDRIDGDSPIPKQQIIVGKPNRILDASDWIWPGSLLRKLVLWNTSIDSHEVEHDTVRTIDQYLAYNELHDVQVLVNAYRPGIQWSRLVKNKEINPLWRYTMGAISTSFYTLFPGRFFGGDHYNPWTNTISIYSDSPAVALHEGGHAKDVNQREHKGLYSAIYSIPIVPLYHEARATNEALSYLHSRCDLGLSKDAYKVLHPAYGTYVGGAAQIVVGPIANLAVIPGHVSGRIAANRSSQQDCSVLAVSPPNAVGQPATIVPATTVPADANSQ